MADDVFIRSIEEAEYPVLEDFIYHAIFLPPGVAPLPRDIIYKEEIYAYVKDFGGADDCGVVADLDGQVIGAAWTRIIPAYGYIDDRTPELAISVLPNYRGRGVGAMLMASLFERLRERGYRRTFLSVQKGNPAIRLYERLGYRITGERLDGAGNEDYLMVKELAGEC